LQKGGLHLIVIDKQSRVPVYEQIKNQIITLIRLGVYNPNDKLPSIRSITSEAGVNVNTVKKVFAELEISGVIYTVPGTGSFVSEAALDNSLVTQKIKGEIKDLFQRAVAIGVTREEITDILNEVLKEGER
ncbi:MAG: GntR family transcriptional regulator, partial [Clostridia bacterium]|nr:GntR family transcriptional regulator [Clostridia bacterium]